jgi:plasmid stability protein
MTDILIRDVDDHLVEALQARAKAHARSLDREVIELLNRGLAAEQTWEQKLADVRRIAAMTPKDVPQTDSVVLLREDRDGR